MGRQRRADLEPLRARLHALDASGEPISPTTFRDLDVEFGLASGTTSHIVSDMRAHGEISLRARNGHGVRVASEDTDWAALVQVAELPGPVDGRCPKCNHAIRVERMSEIEGGGEDVSCLMCGWRPRRFATVAEETLKRSEDRAGHFVTARKGPR
jgi:hypothetical protein